jgi:putative DNA primase/helicase
VNGDIGTPTRLEEVLGRLRGVKQAGAGYMALCPAHEDRCASLSVASGEEGRVLLYCQAGCKTADVAAAIGLPMAKLMGDAKGSEGDKAKIVATYDYCDESGELLYQVVRFEPKGFRQRRPRGQGWEWKLDGVRRVLYRLPEVLQAVKSREAIYICEGEKDVEALERAGCAATCNAGGSGKWRPEYSQALAGANVIIVADRDEPGRRHAAAVAAALRDVAGALCVVEARTGKDAADHLAAGHGPEEFVRLDLAADEAQSESPNEGGPPVAEAAHAAVLREKWRNLYRWSHAEDCWRRWNGAVWEETPRVAVVSAAQKALRRYYGHCLAESQGEAEYKRLRDLHAHACKHANVVAGLAFLSGERGFLTLHTEWDADPWALNCADGILDLRSQTLHPHDPDALCTKIARWSYADSDSSGAWQRHLQLCLPSAEVRRQVQRDLGRALVAGDLEEVLPIWYGTGANGKSTTERALLGGVGSYAKKAVNNLLVMARSERHPTEIAHLAGSRLIFCEEIQDGKHLAEALVKDLTGGAPKTARFMNKDFFEFEQTFSLFLLVNHRPVISGTDKGIWRRIRLVPWTVSVPAAKQRPQDEIVAELDADGAWMLRWMVAGLADWQADHHWVAEEVEVATAAYRAEQDRLGEFLADACEEKPFAEVSAADLHAAHARWCIGSGEEEMTKTALGKALKSRGFTQKRGRGGAKLWQGLCLVGTRWDTFPVSSSENASQGEDQENASQRVPDASVGGLFGAS